MPRTLDIRLIAGSPVWERKIAEPLVTPKKRRLIKKNIWFASATAAMDDSPSWPIIRVSTKDRELLSRLCATTGRAMENIFR